MSGLKTVRKRHTTANKYKDTLRFLKADPSAIEMWEKIHERHIWEGLHEERNKELRSLFVEPLSEVAMTDSITNHWYITEQVSRDIYSFYTSERWKSLHVECEDMRHNVKVTLFYGKDGKKKEFYESWGYIFKGSDMYMCPILKLHDMLTELIDREKACEADESESE
tara:strand:+ start:97 stop:597 length:501 start_codon:yes stop_codon:yes gene_type:complete